MSKGIRVWLATAVFLVTVAATGFAQGSEDLDNHKFEVQGNWWYAHPSGYFGLNGSNNYINFDRDFDFQSYSTFTAKIDYRWKHKHHLLFAMSPVDYSRTATLGRTIMFDNKTFNINTTVSTQLRSFDFAPGYQYDIIRRNHGFFGVEANVVLLDTSATLNAAASANGQTAAFSGSRSFFAGIPEFGPTGRWYPLHSNRLQLEGAITGMSFFGYGNYLSTHGDIGLTVWDNLVVRAGYTLGSRLSVHGTSDQIAIQFTQTGPTVGLGYAWGEAPPIKPNVVGGPSNWHIDWVPLYVWGAGISGTAGAAYTNVPVHASFSDIVSNLNFGYMSDLDVRYKKVGLTTDLVFLSLSTDEKSTPLANGAYSGYTTNNTTFWVAPELYYRVIDNQRVTIDGLLGARFWYINNSLDLQAGTFPQAQPGQSQSWIDPLVGARFHLNIKDGFYGVLSGDAGGFGVNSKQSYQFYTGVGKLFKDKYSVDLGYRYLYEDYQNLGFLLNAHLSGLLLGFDIHFK